MTVDTNALFRQRDVRNWMIVQLVAVVGWILGIVAMTLAGLDALAVLVAMVAVAFGIGFVTDPRRRWWGSGPAAVMADRAARRRYQVVLTIAMVATLGVLLAAAMLIPLWAAG